MISISPDITGRLRVTFPYTPEVVAKIKTMRHAGDILRASTGVSNTPNRFWMKSFLFSRRRPRCRPLLALCKTSCRKQATVNESAPQQPIPRSTSGASPLPDPAQALLYQDGTELSTVDQEVHPFSQREGSERDGGQRNRSISLPLAVNLNVSASTQNQAFNALLFLYREVLSKELGSP